MSVILILIIASLLVAGGFLIAYIWAVRSGQYDDKFTPSVRILFEDSKKNSEHRVQNAERKEKNIE
ncbi:MAG: cbb3-type cytochrome oxidase assembly protein CcoS [Bacteroidota bacterium]